MPKEDVTEPEVVRKGAEKGSEEDAPEKEEAGVTVDLEKKAPEAKKTEPQYVRLEDLERIRKEDAERIDKQFKKFGFIGRKLDELGQRMDTYARPAPKKQAGEPADFDAMVETDWKSAVAGVAKTEAEQLFRSWQESELRRTRELQELEVLDRNRQKVLTKHPELNDPESEKSKVFMKILNENPSYCSNNYGPILAMNDMELALSGNGQDTRELERSSRAQAAGLPRGQRATSNGKFVLSKDEKEFCDHNGIKYEEYAKHANARRGGARTTEVD